MSLYQDHVKKWKNCQACDLCHGRGRIVLARGSIPCQVLFIGEAPGPSEDALGRPFIGPAGKELDRIIASVAIALGGLPSLAFTNLVACIPKDDDNNKFGEPPKPAIEACAGRLNEFVRLCQPKLIVCVGKLAAKHVYGQAQFSEVSDSSLSWLGEGEFLKFTEIIPPAAIIRAEISQRGLLVQRTVITLIDAFGDL